MAPRDQKSGSGFLKGVRSEWKNISWPSRETVGKHFVTVIVITIILGIFIYGLDSFFQFLLSLIV